MLCLRSGSGDNDDKYEMVCTCPPRICSHSKGGRYIHVVDISILLEHSVPENSCMRQCNQRIITEEDV